MMRLPAACRCPGPQVMSHVGHTPPPAAMSKPLQVCPGITTPDGGCLAVVLRTGFYTTQGDLVRTIAFSTDRVTVGNQEAFWFISVRVSPGCLPACAQSVGAADAPACRPLWWCSCRSC